MPPVARDIRLRRAMRSPPPRSASCRHQLSLTMVNSQLPVHFKHAVNTSYARTYAKAPPDRADPHNGSRGPGWKEKPTGNDAWGSRAPTGGLALPRPVARSAGWNVLICGVVHSASGRQCGEGNRPALSHGDRRVRSISKLLRVRD